MMESILSFVGIIMLMYVIYNAFIITFSDDEDTVEEPIEHTLPKVKLLAVFDFHTDEPLNGEPSANLIERWQNNKIMPHRACKNDEVWDLATEDSSDINDQFVKLKVVEVEVAEAVDNE